ncbi:MAG: mycofactocin-coupled SDR family oxidoreductase [Acidimicrobiia bacterium]
MGRLDGKVALVTGAARGQGRAHALRLAEEGADIIAVDLCDQIATVGYPMATPDDLAETAKLVENLDRRILTRQADVRDSAALSAAVSEGVSELGHLDVVVANAGIASVGLTWELSDEAWQDMLDVNLTGVWRTCKATIPTLIEQGTGGSIILTSSVAGLCGFGMLSHYTAAKHGVVGLMRSLVNEVSPHRIRVNSVHPGSVDTDMVHNDMMHSLFGADSREEFAEIFKAFNTLPVEWVEPVDIANAALFLASDEARYVTGLTLYVDAGFLTKVP